MTRTDKIELVRRSTSQGVKEENSSKLVGGAEMGSWGGEDLCKVAAGGSGWVRQRLAEQAIPHMHADKPEQLGSGTDCTTQGPIVGNPLNL